MIFDVHTHIFPEKIARRASENIGAFYGLAMAADGTADTLLRLSAEAGIDRCLVHSVAVTPKNVAHINDFIAAEVEQHPDRLTGFLTLHPDMDDMAGELRKGLDRGLRGVKIHPDMQQFALDGQGADKLFSLCEGVCPVLIHTGDPRYQFSNPQRMRVALHRHPRLAVICAHLGGWGEWRDAETLLAHENVYVDTSSSLYALPPAEAARAIRAFGTDRTLFGTDYPMWNPTEELARFLALPLDQAERDAIFSENLLTLLGEVS